MNLKYFCFIFYCKYCITLIKKVPHVKQLNIILYIIFKSDSLFMVVHIYFCAELYFQATWAAFYIL